MSVNSLVPSSPIVAPIFRICSKRGDVIVSYGNLFVVYYLDNLQLCKISDPLPVSITLLQTDGNHVFAASDNIVYFYNIYHTISRRIEIDKNIKFTLIYKNIIVIVDIENNVHVIDAYDSTKILKVQLPQNFIPTCVNSLQEHRKHLLLGGSNGEIKLLHLIDGEIFYEYSPEPPYNSTCIAQSPLVSIVAFGYANGNIQVRDMRIHDRTCSFKQDGEITAIAFRIDVIQQMATANSKGTIVLWDLIYKRCMRKISDAHFGPIVVLFFDGEEPILYSAGINNRVIKWSIKNEQFEPLIDTILALPPA